jgi:hypothetical protein
MVRRLNWGGRHEWNRREAVLDRKVSVVKDEWMNG